VETQDDLHELLRAANFLTLSELVHMVVAQVVVSMQAVSAVSFDLPAASLPVELRFQGTGRV
jgi:hypothetical protein